MTIWVVAMFVDITNPGWHV